MSRLAHSARVSHCSIRARGEIGLNAKTGEGYRPVAVMREEGIGWSETDRHGRKTTGSPCCGDWLLAQGCRWRQLSWVTGIVQVADIAAASQRKGLLPLSANERSVPILLKYSPP